MTLGTLIEALGGKLAQGKAKMAVDGVNSSESASPTELVFAEDAAAARQALASKAGAVVLKPGCLDGYSSNVSIAVIEFNQPRLWFARAAKLLNTARLATGVHESAVLGPNVNWAQAWPSDPAQSLVTTRSLARTAALLPAW